jgi:hypothetical protein
MIESGFITSVEQSISSTGSTVVALLNFLTEDVFDEDEVEELLRDAAELLSPFGTVLDMRLPPHSLKRTMGKSPLLKTSSTLCRAVASCM